MDSEYQRGPGEAKNECPGRWANWKTGASRLEVRRRTLVSRRWGQCGSKAGFRRKWYMEANQDRASATEPVRTT